MSFRYLDFKEARIAVRTYGELLHERNRLMRIAVGAVGEAKLAEFNPRIATQRKEAIDCLRGVRDVLDNYSRQYLRVKFGPRAKFNNKSPEDFSSSNEDLQEDIRECEGEFTAINALRSGLILSSEEELPFVKWQEYLQKAISEIRIALKERGVANSPVERVAADIQTAIQTEARLRRQCEEDVRKYPEQEEIIRRSYRKAIDALRER